MGDIFLSTDRFYRQKVAQLFTETNLHNEITKIVQQLLTK